MHTPTDSTNRQLCTVVGGVASPPFTLVSYRRASDVVDIVGARPRQTDVEDEYDWRPIQRTNNALQAGHRRMDIVIPSSGGGVRTQQQESKLDGEVPETTISDESFGTKHGIFLEPKKNANEELMWQRHHAQTFDKLRVLSVLHLFLSHLRMDDLSPNLRSPVCRRIQNSWTQTYQARMGSKTEITVRFDQIFDRFSVHQSVQPIRWTASQQEVLRIVTILVHDLWTSDKLKQIFNQIFWQCNSAVKSNAKIRISFLTCVEEIHGECNAILNKLDPTARYGTVEVLVDEIVAIIYAETRFESIRSDLRAAMGPTPPLFPSLFYFIVAQLRENFIAANERKRREQPEPLPLKFNDWTGMWIVEPDTLTYSASDSSSPQSAGWFATAAIAYMCGALCLRMEQQELLIESAVDAVLPSGSGTRFVLDGRFRQMRTLPNGLSIEMLSLFGWSELYSMNCLNGSAVEIYLFATNVNTQQRVRLAICITPIEQESFTAVIVVATKLKDTADYRSSYLSPSDWIEVAKLSMAFKRVSPNSE